jgi:hypothetical protein
VSRDGFPRAALSFNERVIPLVGIYWCKDHWIPASAEYCAPRSECYVVPLCIIDSGGNGRPPPADSQRAAVKGQPKAE